MACGGGGSGGGDSGGAAGGGGVSASSVIPDTTIAIPDTTRVVNVADASGASQAELSAATYQINMFWAASNGVTWNEILGTGFAIGGNLMATNAHVTAEVLNRARLYGQSGVTLTGVSAFQAETGQEVPLLEALVHPSYNGSVRSPDIGLFVARSTLPVALEVASDAQVSALRAGDTIRLNGFPGDVFNVLFAQGFQPGLSIPRATLFQGNIQSLQKFDERAVIDPNNPLDIDMIQHSMDTSGGTSGSPILSDGRVVGVHNSGLGFSSVVIGADGRPTVQQTTQSTASWGIHVKHLKSLLAEWQSGVLAAEKRFRIPIDASLLALGQTAGTTSAGPVIGSLSATVQNPTNPNVTHQITMNFDGSGAVFGRSDWPANIAGPERSFTLTGVIDANGQFEVVDNTPEVNPGFRRGIYTGFINPASGAVDGDYSELDEALNEITFFGNFVGTVR